MSKARIITFVAVAAAALAVFAFVGLPYTSLDFASAQYYDAPEAGAGIEFGNLNGGDAAPASVPNFDTSLRGSRAVIYDAPGGNVIFTDSGECPITAFDSTGAWALCWLGGDSYGWVPLG